MPVFLLSPVSVENPNWKASTYKGEVKVRAPNEDIARSAACLAFGIAVARTHNNGPTPLCPWRLPDLAICTIAGTVEGGEVETVEILDPPHHNDALAGVDFG